MCRVRVRVRVRLWITRAYHSVEGDEVGLEIVLEDDDGALVAHLVAVVGSGEDGNATTVVGHLIASVLALVRAHDVLQIVLLQEPLRDIRTKGKAHTCAFDTRSRKSGQSFRWSGACVVSCRAVVCCVVMSLA